MQVFLSFLIGKLNTYFSYSRLYQRTQETEVQITKKFNIIIWQVHNNGADNNSADRVMHRSLEMQD
jgi:hypothetical protein